MKLKASTLAITFALGAASLALAACEDHFTTQEAYETCGGIADRSVAMSEEAFADCVDCYERCGIDCEQQNEPPPDEFVCPDDLGE